MNVDLSPLVLFLNQTTAYYNIVLHCIARVLVLRVLILFTRSVYATKKKKIFYLFAASKRAEFVGFVNIWHHLSRSHPTTAHTLIFLGPRQKSFPPPPCIAIERRQSGGGWRMCRAEVPVGPFAIGQWADRKPENALRTLFSPFSISANVTPHRNTLSLSFFLSCRLFHSVVRLYSV